MAASLLRSSFALLLAVLVLAGCTNTTNRVETGGVARTSVVLDRTGPVLITMPRGSSPAGASDTVTRTLDASFSRYAAIVDIHPAEYHSIADLQRVISQHNYKYIVVPSIVHWSGNGEWSQNAPEVDVKVTVLNAATGQEVSSNFLQSKAPAPGSMSSAVNIDSDDPADMLQHMVDDYVDALYDPYGLHF